MLASAQAMHPIAWTVVDSELEIVAACGRGSSKFLEARRSSRAQTGQTAVNDTDSDQFPPCDNSSCHWVGFQNGSGVHRQEERHFGSRIASTESAVSQTLRNPKRGESLQSMPAAKATGGTAD